MCYWKIFAVILGVTWISTLTSGVFIYTGKYTHTFIGDLCKQQHSLCHTGFGKYVSSIDKWALQ